MLRYQVEIEETEVPSIIKGYNDRMRQKVHAWLGAGRPQAQREDLGLGEPQCQLIGMHCKKERKDVQHARLTRSLFVNSTVIVTWIQLEVKQRIPMHQTCAGIPRVP